MAFVEWKQGNVSVKVFDDAYVNRTEVEIQRTIQRIVDLNWQMLELKKV